MNVEREKKQNLKQNDGDENKTETNPILKIEQLSISFTQYEKGMRQTTLPIIQDFEIEVKAGEIVTIVGASGSGKSLLAHAILGILPYNAERKGKITYCGEDLTEERMQKLRGREIVMVPQSISYLDPLMKIGPQICKGTKKKERKERLRTIFQRYGLGREVETRYPFELSGGMNRRVLISTAMIEEPKLVIADEPTPGLDFKVAKQAMEHFRELADMGAGVLVITHDLELAVETADKIVVFYAGNTIEEANASDFKKEERLRHPYTKALWRALPQNGFHSIKGTQPYVKDMPKGCPFAPRCDRYTKECDQKIAYQSLRGGKVRCIHAL